jgi:hypothetical protein
MAYRYQWNHPSNKPEGTYAYADTHIGRVVVETQKRGPRTSNRFMVRIVGTVKARDLINMDSAKNTAETKVARIMAAKEAAEAKGEPWTLTPEADY